MQWCHSRSLLYGVVYHNIKAFSNNDL
ncbi:hypothetical protein HPB128_22g1 [Helicobacter pylori B128]|nr:hypothetical protein HPB128_22g1 [Helicobacter pylori B128]